MLAKPHRLVKQKDFEKIFKHGRAHYARSIGIKILANQLERNRFGIIVSAKVSKKAVERNKLKRQIRQALKELDAKLIAGLDAAIIALPGLLNQDYAAIKSELEQGFIRLKLLKRMKPGRNY